MNILISTRMKTAFLTLLLHVSFSWGVSLCLKKNFASPSILCLPNTNKSRKNHNSKKSTAKQPCVSKSTYLLNLKSKRKAQSNRPAKNQTKSSPSKSWKCPKTSLPPPHHKTIETNSFTGISGPSFPPVNTKKTTSLTSGSCSILSIAHSLKSSTKTPPALLYMTSTAKSKCSNSNSKSTSKSPVSITVLLAFISIKMTNITSWGVSYAWGQRISRT